MASYRAVASGNWSATGTWNVWNGSAWVAAGAVPGSADDAWSNNFTVTIDQNVTVLTIRNATTGAPGTGNTAGGGFLIANSGFTVTCTNDVLITYLHTSGALINITASGGSTTININVPAAATVNVAFMNVTGNTTLNINGNIAQRVNGANNHFITIAAASVVNIIGTLTQNTSVNPAAQANNNSVIRFSVAGWTLNMTGNLIIPASLGGSTGVSGVVRYDASGTINMVGDCLNDSYASANGGIFSCIAASGVAGTVSVTGTCRGGGGSGAQNIGAIYAVGASVVTHVGAAYAGNTDAVSTGNPAIVNLSATSSTFVSGPLISGNYGAMPVIATRLFLSNNVSKYIEFASNSTNGALFPAAAPTRSTMYSPNTLADSPATNNVRDGIVYALGSQTGTLKVPNPANVALGIQTDNTVGTAALTPASVWDYLLSAITTPNSIGKLVKDMLDAAISSRLAAAGYTAPDNAGIAAIKTKTDNLPSSPADEVTSQAILTALGSIEVDVPTPAEISAQVWIDQPDRLKNVSTVETTGDQIASLT